MFSFLLPTVRLPKNLKGARSLSRGFGHAVLLGKPLPGTGGESGGFLKRVLSVAHIAGLPAQRELVPGAGALDGGGPMPLEVRGPPRLPAALPHAVLGCPVLSPAAPRCPRLPRAVPGCPAGGRDLPRGEYTPEADARVRGCTEPRFSQARPRPPWPDRTRLCLIFPARDSFYKRLLKTSDTRPLCQMPNNLPPPAPQPVGRRRPPENAAAVGDGDTGQAF